MYPSWGNYGAPQSQNYGAPGPRKLQVGGHTGSPTSFGSLQAPSSGSMFSSLQEQHRQQMQQLQMLHQKQLQNVLHHGGTPAAYGAGGPPGGYSAPAWHSTEAAPLDRSGGTQSHIKGDGVAIPPEHSQPPLPPQPHKIDAKPAPPPPEHQSAKPPEANAAPKAKDLLVKDKDSSNLQDQQQLWYKQHLENLQKLKQEKTKQNPNHADPPNSHAVQPPLPSEPPKGAPPPPPPKEEQPAPPPPPEPDKKQDPEEAARLQQLQAAAAQWQQVQQQRVSLHYQALMRQHEKLQQILEKYQPLIQQPANLQAMSAELQLRHYEVQKQQFTPLFQEWELTFRLWFEQFQTYPHKDQLHDYENQWKQWQDQMNATNAHIQETIATLTAMVPYAAMQYNSAAMGPYGAYPGQGMRMPPPPTNQPPPPLSQPPPVTRPQMNQPPPPTPPSVAVGPTSQGPPPGPPPGPRHSPTAAGPPPKGGAPAGLRPACPVNIPPPNFNSIGGPRASNPGFSQPMPFEGPPRFDQRFERPPLFQPPPRRFDGPPRFTQPGTRFDGTARFDQPPPRFDGPPRLNQPGSRFDGPPRFDHPPPLPFDKRSRFDQPPRQAGPQPPTEGPPTPPPRQEEPPPQAKQGPAQAVSGESSLKSVELPPTDEQTSKTKSGHATADKDMTDDMLDSVGFFIPNEPIPQTQMTSAEEDDSMDICNSPKQVDGNPAQSAATPTESKQATSQDYPKPKGSARNNTTSSVASQKQEEKQAPAQLQSRPQHVGPPPARGRGQPLGPMRGRGGGRGQRGRVDFSGQNSGPPEKESDEMRHEFLPPEEEFYEVSEQEDYEWQGPPYEEFGGEALEEPGEEIWMPEDHHFEAEEEYYEEPMQGPPRRRGAPVMRGRPMTRGGAPLGLEGPPMGRGGPPMGRGGPPMGRGGPPMGRGGPPMHRGGPLMGRGGPPMGRGGPPMGRGGPPMGRGGPPMGRGGPPMGRGGPPMGRGGPPMGRGGPPMGRGGLPMGRGGPLVGRGCPPMGRGGPPMGRGEPMNSEWEETEPAEYHDEEESCWGNGGPPMRGMRPPFPPGRGRRPCGHPAFMPGRGRPPHFAHGPPDEEPFGYGMDSGDMDESGPYMHHGEDPHNLMHSGRGRGRWPPPHKEMETGDESFYRDEMESEQDWRPPYGRRPPMPHEIIERGGEMRGGPMGRGRTRGATRPGAPHQEEDGYGCGFIDDYGHGEDDHQRRPPRLDDPRRDGRFFDPEWERKRSPPARDDPPPAPEHYRDDGWLEERDRGPPHPFEEYDRRRGDIRVRDYTDEAPSRSEDPAHPPDWNRPSTFDPPTERTFTPFRDHRDEPPLQNEPGENLPANSADQQGGNVLALSQRQHEIILKAAQELKRMRELQDVKTDSAPQPTLADPLPDLPAGLLGLEIPPEVRNALKGMSASVQTAKTQSWDASPATSAPTVVPKTVDYAHGHEPGTTVEKIAYGERIVLRPDPDRGYEKEPLRDPYGRDPYYDRRPDPYPDRREYSREREFYREKPAAEYERERFGRERYPPRDRDERPPHRPGYREREHDLRERDRSGSRDREDPFGRPAYERPPYERPGHERLGPERYGHSSSPFDRRGYPEDRGPPSALPLAPPPQPLPPVEKKPEIKNVDDLLKPPGRLSRPERIVVIMRGLPGSGKSHVAKLIRDKEVDCGGAPPRVLVLDDYFMTEIEKIEKDPDTGKRVKRKVLEYEYEPEMEDTYRSSMLKTFKKTLDDGFFPFIILDTINNRVNHFDQFWSAAKTKGFEVYIAEIVADAHTCAKRNAHARTLKDIAKMSNGWESTPRHMVRLDVRALLQDAAIEEVEMEDFDPEDEPEEAKREEEEEGDLGYIPKSKWEMDTSEAKLDKLDGLGSGSKRKRDGDHVAGLEDFLQLPDDYATRKSQPGKKRVRWADLEEQKDADRKRAIGFVVGQTDWEKITDDSGRLAQKALNRTKYF